jgi:hypothetical protein
LQLGLVTDLEQQRKEWMNSSTFCVSASQHSWQVAIEHLAQCRGAWRCMAEDQTATGTSFSHKAGFVQFVFLEKKTPKPTVTECKITYY